MPRTGEGGKPEKESEGSRHLFPSVTYDSDLLKLGGPKPKPWSSHTLFISPLISTRSPRKYPDTRPLFPDDPPNPLLISHSPFRTLNLHTYASLVVPSKPSPYTLTFLSRPPTPTPLRVDFPGEAQTLRNYDRETLFNLRRCYSYDTPFAMFTSSARCCGWHLRLYTRRVFVGWKAEERRVAGETDRGSRIGILQPVRLWRVHVDREFLPPFPPSLLNFSRVFGGLLLVPFLGYRLPVTVLEREHQGSDR